MKVEKLTPRRIASLKAGTYVDSLTPGLALRIRESGSNSWSLRYRVNRRLRRLTLGSADVLSLADARKNARDALKIMATGVDPAEQKQQRRDADTVGDFVPVYITKHAKLRKKSWKNDERHLRREVLPRWKHKAMRDITKRDVRELLDTIVARGAPIVANRVRSLLHKFFRIAMELDVVEHNPVIATAVPGVEHQRNRVLTHDEIRQFWTTCDELTPAMAAAFRVRLLTAQRRGEVVNMRWADIDNDWWTIPGSGSKNKLPHRVPLSAPVLDMLRSLKTTHTTRRYDFVFVGARGQTEQATAMAMFRIPDFRGHDLRRTAASLMTGAGTSRLVVSKILNHVESGITAVYDRHSYDAEKRAALDAWARQLASIVGQTDSANVLAFAKGSR